MELHFRKEQQAMKPNKPKQRRKNIAGAGNGTKFVGVRQRPSGRWVAEIKDTTQKIRMWLGTFETAEEAARAYDEAACLLRGNNTRTNFNVTPCPDSPLASRIRKLLHVKKLAKMNDGSINPSVTSTTTVATAAVSTTTESYVDRSASVITNVNVQNNNFEQVVGIEDVYRPSFRSSEGGELSPVSSLLSDVTWVFDSAIDNRFPLFEGGGFGFQGSSTAGVELAEVDKLQVIEKQFSASLYELNGVNECLEGIMQYNASDPVWDLPSLCSQLHCRTS